MGKYCDHFLAFLYEKLLESCGRHMPKRFWEADPISKTSIEFTIYLKIIDLYVHMLKRLAERGQPFSIKLQERRLQKILRIANKTKWWNEYFSKNNISPRRINNLSDFKQIPPVNRMNLMDVPKEDILTCSAENKSIIWRRSGGSTTGTPFIWGLNKSLLYLNVLSHFIKKLKEEDFPYHRYLRENFYIDYNWPHGFIRSEFRWFSRGDFTVRTTDADADKQIRKISEIVTELGTAVVRTSPSELPFLIQELKRQGLKPPISFFTITGQILEEDVRKLIIAYLDCKVMVHYGAQEMGPLSIECRDYHGFYHLFSERTIVEILDDAGETVSAGSTGNITVTCLDNTIMPLIRYQPGDIGALHYEKACSCEEKSPLLEIKSRDTDIIKFSNGESKSAQRILRRFSVQPYISSVRRFQVRQDRLDEVKILLEVRTPIPTETIDMLRQGIQNAYGEMLTINIEQTSSITQDGPKFKVFVPLKNPTATIP